MPLTRSDLISFCCYLLSGLLSYSFCNLCQASNLQVYNATDSIAVIDVQAVYYVPYDGEPLLDWRERVDYHMRRIQKFHTREFDGQSTINYTIYPSPFIASATKLGFPQDDVNRFFWNIVNEVWQSGRLSFDPNAFPIILVFSDNNFSPAYDDWSRICRVENCLYPPPHSDCAGFVAQNGEDRPGTRCGGACSVFWPEKHMGFGLVTADGWRVPIKGTDCVVYHEGVGHAIGLPHPEPIDNSVMGLAQYVDSINKAWINNDQKLALGWKPSEINNNNLFTQFEVSHSPTKPSATDSVQIIATFPKQTKWKSIRAEIQQALREPFRQIEPVEITKHENGFQARWTIPPIGKNQSLAYRVRLTTEAGEQEEIWDYFKIRE
ncbi:MAG: hypothetical protein C4527_10895 [Candidatus Omnitrophota bacterium]|jgi:hypothetical protein|nr:MAG: hypothetical protein C4527_10895 [Candidatus Omnitrophota bacterium]